MQVPLWETVKEEAVSEFLYLCPSCPLVYSQANCLVVHMKKAHHVDVSRVEQYGLPLEGSVMRLKRVWKGDQGHVRTCYKCLKCNTVMHHHRKFAQHIRVDANGQVTCETLCPEGRGLRSYQRTLFLKGYKNYLCHTCGASFTEKDTFYHHIEAHGEVVAKKYMCEYCPYSATRQLRIMNHMASKHSNEPRPRPHVCELCGKGFFNKNMLTQHKADVHIKDKKHKCHLCPKVFLRRHKLTMHIKLHSGVRPFACNQCGQTFTAAYNLKVHQRLHTGEKPYKCAHCEAAFAQKSSLDVHMKKHGLGPTRQGRTQKALPAPTQKTTDPPKNPSPPHQPPLQKVDSPPPPPPQPKLQPQPPPSRMEASQFTRMDSPPTQHQQLESPHPPPPQLPPMQQLEHVTQHRQNHHPLDFHQHPRLEASSPHGPTVDGRDAPQPLRGDPSQHPAQPLRGDPSQHPAQPLRGDPSQHPAQPLRGDPSQHPAQPLRGDPSQHPAQPLRGDPSQHAAQPLRGHPSQHPAQPLRMEPYMYTSYTGVAFPGLPGSSYPFYQNL